MKSADLSVFNSDATVSTALVSSAVERNCSSDMSDSFLYKLSRTTSRQTRMSATRAKKKKQEETEEEEKDKGEVKKKRGEGEEEENVGE